MPVDYVIVHYKREVNVYFQNLFREVVDMLQFGMIKSKFRSLTYLEFEEILQFVVHFHEEFAEMYEIHDFLVKFIHVDIDESVVIFSLNLSDYSQRKHHFG